MWSNLVFEWDSQKADSNLRKHGLSFRTAQIVFSDPLRTTITDDRNDYNETRQVTYGAIDDVLYCVTFTQRLSAIRIISARKANARERKRYGHRPIHH
jgi:uncharacterized protein